MKEMKEIMLKSTKKKKGQEKKGKNSVVCVLKNIVQNFIEKLCVILKFFLNKKHC